MFPKRAALAGLGLAICVLLLIGVSFAPAAFASPERQVTASPAPTRTLAPGEQIYVVEAGDNFWTIALKFYGSGSKYPLIVQANNLTNASRLRAGMILIIPPLVAEPAPTLTFAATATLNPPTATPASTETPSIATTVIAPTPISTATPLVATTSTNSDNATAASPVIAILNILSALCLLGSLVCAVLAYDSYRHAQRMMKRKQIGSRIRVTR